MCVMPNPSPVMSDAFKANQRVANSWMPDEPLGRRQASAKVGQSVEEYLFSLPDSDRITLIKRVVTEAVLLHRAGCQCPWEVLAEYGKQLKAS